MRAACDPQTHMDMAAAAGGGARTGSLSLYASTGSWKGQANSCLHRHFIRVFWRYCSWLVMRPGRLTSFTGGCGGAGGAWGIVCGREGLSKSSYSREGLRMRLPELVCCSITPPDKPTRELSERAGEAVTTGMMGNEFS